MNRRGFLTRLAQTAAFVAVAPTLRVLAPREQVVASIPLEEKTLTTFGELTAEQRSLWSYSLWEQARNKMFVQKMAGKDERSLIQILTDLPKQYARDERGMINFVADFA